MKIQSTFLTVRETLMNGQECNQQTVLPTLTLVEHHQAISEVFSQPFRYTSTHKKTVDYITKRPVLFWDFPNNMRYSGVLINRPGVAGAVLQTPPSLID